MSGLPDLLSEIRNCTACEGLPLGAKPLLQGSKEAKILLVGQAPGRKTHEKGRPFDDVSGDRLRDWLGVSRDQFYDAEKFAIIPMGFCFPGSGKTGDLPPRPECAALWREKLLDKLQGIQLTIILGKYALNYHMPQEKGKPLTDIVFRWREHLPTYLPLPHPSPRNIRWFRKNPWFEDEVLPVLRQRVCGLF